MPHGRVLKATGKADSAVLDTSVEKMPGGHQLRVSVKAPERPWVPFAGSIELATDSKKQPKIVVKFVGWTIGDAPFGLPESQLRAFVTGALDHQMTGEPVDVLNKVFGGPQDWRGFGVLAAIARDEAAPIQGRVRAVDLMEQYPARRPSRPSNRS